MARNKQSRRPNVIVFFTDQQRWDTTGVHGNPLELTPNFDEMARAGTHVYNAVSPQPVCGPARACLQSGMYATSVGCHRNGIPLPQDVPTLAKCFSAAGYQTGYIGKWHLGDSDAVSAPFRGGYDYWLAANALEHTSDAYDCSLFDGRNKKVKLPGYRVDALTDAAIRFVNERQDKPFLLFMSFLEPHFQNHRDDHPAPDGYAERYSGRWMPPDLSALMSERTGMTGGNAYQSMGGYLGMVKRLDEALGRLRDALKSLGMLENTIIVFTTDHGCHFRTRNNEYKRSGHESSVRIPMAFSGPGFNGGGRLQELVSLVDLTPTLLDAVGIKPPRSMQGRSIMPLLRREPVEWPDDALIQISESQVGRAVRTHRWKYGVIAPNLNGSQHAGAELYQEAYLYDLMSDPYELTNLIGLKSHGAVAKRMRERLTRRMVEVGETKPTIEVAPERASGQRRVTPAEVEQ
jgi:arylsulfatase A-like enzyme